MAGGVVSANQCRLHGTGHKSVVSSLRNAPVPLCFVLTAQSRLQLKGTATIGTWSCKSKKVSGKLILHTNRTTLARLFNSIQAAQFPDPPPLHLPIRKPAIGELSIPVTSLDGNSSGMDHDMWRALKAKAHPTIRYGLIRVLGARLFWNKTSHTPYVKLRVLGSLTLAGVTRKLLTAMYVRQVADGQYSIHATSTVLMRNFGVTPPTAFFWVDSRP